MKQIINMLLILATAVGLVVLPTVTAVHAQCTNATLSGNYRIVWQGFTTKTPATGGNEFPWAGAGVFTFDGAGNWSATWTDALNGTISRGNTGSGTYTVNPNCTGSMAFDQGFTFDLVIASGGAEVSLVATVPGNSVLFDLKKQ